MRERVGGLVEGGSDSGGGLGVDEDGGDGGVERGRG